MNDNNAYESVAIKPSRFIIVIYSIVKQIFYLFLVEGYYWIPRGIAGIIMVSLVFLLTEKHRLSNRKMSFCVPLAVALTEIVLCAAIGGDRLTYIFLIGCSLFSLMFADYVGLFIVIAVTTVASGVLAFGFGYTLIGANFSRDDEFFNYMGLVVVDILIFLIGKYSVGALTRFKSLGRTFNTVIDTTPNYIAIVNSKAKVEYISESLAKWLGIDKKEFAFDLPFIDLFPTSELKLLFGELMRRDGYVEDMFQAVIDGSTHWFMLRSVKMGTGKSARFIEWEDVTIIIDAQKAAEAAARAKSEFLAKMSHEIRTPLNAIIGITELILRDEIPPRTYEHALSIKSAGKNLLSIINDILDFSKIDSGMMEIVPVEYAFSSLINDVINIIRIKSMEKSLFFVVNLNSAIPAKLIGDEVRIRQIMINLLGNAVKYTEEGFICLTVDSNVLDDDTIMLKVEVSDSGIGIREEDLDKLFGYFVQFDQSSNKGVQGTGLGLAISKSLSVAMGGDISASSEYGKGSTFTTVIPQGIGKYEKFASVENSSEKTVLLYELRDIYADSIAGSLENLDVKCVLVRDKDAFCDALRHCDYPYVFVSSFLFEEAKQIINSIGVNPLLVLLTDYGEEIKENNIRTIAMPAHSMSISNILNDVTENAGYGGSDDINITFSAPEIQVLIVDDISTNLKVAEGLMAPYNMKIYTCLSGTAAIEMIKEVKYDLIFMDHMMPVMDGVEATQLIRALEGEYYKSVPIIALTANAISGVREMFLNNGMSDFLAKPIETSKLNSILEKWIPKDKRKAQVLKKIKISHLDDGDFKAIEALEEAGLDTLSGIKATGGDSGHYIKTLAMFSKDCREKIPQIKSAQNNADLRMYITHVHAFKSALYSLGSPELSGFAAELEAAGRNGDMPIIEERTVTFLTRLDALLETIDRVVSEMRKNSLDSDATIKIDQELLHKLKQALDEMDAQLAGDIINELRSTQFGGETDEAIEDIYQNFLMFEYDNAQVIIDELRVSKK